MILAVGDIHGDWGKLNTLVNKKRPSIVLQCGDFGWWPQWEVKRNTVYHLREKSWTHKGAKLPSDTRLYFCDGNHENHWDLEKLMCADRTKPVNLYSNVFYMPRGCVLQLPDGRNVLFIGGADSIDKNLRTLGIDWYPEELITREDVDYISGIKEKIHIVISHTCPEEIIPDHMRVDKIRDPSRRALSLILEYLKPDLWYFGHWHTQATGIYGNTRWIALDYPGHGGQWYSQIPPRKL